MKKIIVLILCMFTHSYAYEESLNPREKNFIKNHELPIEKKVLLDEIFNDFHPKMQALFNGEAVYTFDEVTKIFKLFNLAIFRRQVTVHAYHHGDSMVFEHPRFPGYIIKIGFNKDAPRKNISRVIFADHINRLIDDTQSIISQVKKVKKYLYHRSGRPEAPLSDFNYVVIAEKIDGIPYDQSPHVTQKHIDDAIAIMNALQPVDATFFEFDASSSNIFFTSDQKIAFVDSRIRMGKTRDQWFERLFTPDEQRITQDLNDKEASFISAHAVPDDVQKTLDFIFSHISNDTRELFAGQGHFSIMDTEGTNVMEDAIKRVLYKDGFRLLSTHTLWSRSLTVEHDLLPGYVLKISFHSDNQRRGIARIIATDEINKIIDDKSHGITRLNKVTKMLYHIPGRPEALNDANYIVVCKKVVGRDYDMSPFTTQRLIDDCNRVISLLNNLSIVIDVIPSNILVDEQGAGHFIDTEMTRGFFRDKWLELTLGR